MVSAVVDQLSRRTTYGYDRAHRQVTVTNALGNVSTSVFDDAGRLTVSIDPLGCRTTLSYDKADRHTQTTDGNGNATQSVYDKAGRQVATVNALGYRTTFGYDAADRQTSITDARGNTSTMQYDAAGRLSAEVDPLARRTTHGYDRVDNRTLKTDARANVITSTYDAVNRHIGDTYPNGRRNTFTYDRVGNRTVMSDETGVYTTTYSARNELTAVTNPDNKQIQYTYDALGRRCRMIDADGGSFTYSHDVKGRLTKLQNPQAQTTTLSYDAVDQMTSRQLANGGRTNHTYDAASRLTVVENLAAGGTVVNRFTYTYDCARNRKTVVEIGARTTWTYDSAYQLTREQRSGSVSFDITYVYDPVGNRLVQIDSGARMTYTYDVANQLLTEQNVDGITTYTHDASGNRTKKDAPGAITFYTWNEDNRLTLAEPPSGDVSFRYNADGRRVLKQTSTETQKFIYDFKKILHETDGSGATDKLYTFTEEEYGELISEHNGLASAYHQYDALGSTDALLDGGSATDRYVYTAFGLEASHSGISDSNFTFVGASCYYQDFEVGLVLLGLRNYDYAQGRFISVDPLRHQSDGKTPYSYVENCPTAMIDPNGMQAERPRTGPITDEEVESLRILFQLHAATHEHAREKYGADWTWRYVDRYGGEIPIPPPGLLEALEAERAAEEYCRRRAGSIGAPTDIELFDWNMRWAELDRLSEMAREGKPMTPQQRARFNTFSQQYQRASRDRMHDLAGTSTIGRALDYIFNPAYGGLGNLDDCLGVMSNFAGGHPLQKAQTTRRPVQSTSVKQPGRTIACSPGVENDAPYAQRASVFSTIRSTWKATRPKGTGQTYEIVQRTDINWKRVRQGGDRRAIGLTNEEAARRYGLAPELDDGSFATLHHLGQDALGPLVEASTRYHGVGKSGQDILHGQFGKNQPHPTRPIDRRAFDVDTREYWRWRGNNQ